MMVGGARIRYRRRGRLRSMMVGGALGREAAPHIGRPPVRFLQAAIDAAIGQNGLAGYVGRPL